MIVAWIVFPLVLAAVSLGCGLLLEGVAGMRLPGPLLLGAGLALVIVAAQFPAIPGATADLTVPLVVGLSVAGFAAALPGRELRIDRWALVAALGAFAFYAAPFALSGEPTFGGYIRLDDTASWLGITDRVIHHGANLDGLAPSSYEAMLDFYLNSDYPIGSFLPLGVGGALLGQDLAWLYQPYLAFLAAMLALALYQLASTVIASRPLRALVAVVAVQSALLFGYTMWGGIKELSNAWLLALVVALLPQLFTDRRMVAGLLPLAVASAAMVAAVGFGGGAWLLPVLGAGLAALWWLWGRRAALWQALAFAGVAVAVSLPSLRTLDFLGEPAASTITNQSRLANLIQPLSKLQVFGIWPVGDFRLRPADMTATRILIAVLALAAVFGLVWAVRRRAWVLLLYFAAAAGTCFAISIFASPWVTAKALAIASPAFVLLAMAGVVSVFDRGRVVEAAVLCAALVGGVLWSNALAYRDVTLAPHTRFDELRTIGERIEGQGPTLMTDYEPFGVRYFLRSADPEGASELRRRQIRLRNGRVLDKIEFADIDRFNLGAVLTYRTLVLRRSPVASRPPSVYNLVWRGRYYELWQRPQEGGGRIVEHLPLGNEVDPAGRPPCGEVTRLAGAAGPQGMLAAVTRTRPLVIGLDRVARPSSWRAYGDDPGAVYPDEGGAARTSVEIPAPGRYGVWVKGAFHGRLDVAVDGRAVGSERHDLSHAGHYVPLGDVALAAGRHAVTLRYEDEDLHPGSGGRPFALGPLVLGRDTADRPVDRVPPGSAGALCGRSFDWIEALR